MKDLPDQTVIKFSKLKWLWFGAMVLVLIWGLVTLIKGEGIIQHIMAIACLLISGLVVYMEVPDIRLINKSRTILSVQGITDSEGQFYPWSAVSGEKIAAVGNYKPNYFLSFSASGRKRMLHLSGLDKSPAQIMSLVKQYRQLCLRFEV